MQIRWGNAFLEANGAGLSTSKRTYENAANTTFEEEVVITVDAWWTAIDQATLIAKCAIFEQALRVKNQDLVLIADNGQPAVVLTNFNSTTGTRALQGVDYPENGLARAEFVTYRSFRFACTANYLINGNAPIILDYTETLDMSGGGRVIDFQLPANGPPIPVQLFAQVPFVVHQHGRAIVQAVSPTAYGAPASPTFPSALLRAPVIRRESKRVGALKWHLTTEWDYEFGSIGNMVGLPNAWIG